MPEVGGWDNPRPKPHYKKASRGAVLMFKCERLDGREHVVKMLINLDE